jgi:hypothetical protein
MKSYLVLFLLVLVLPISLFAQWKRETGFTIGIVVPNQSKNYSNDENIGLSTKLGFNQSWYQPEAKFSFRPEIGLNLARLTVNNIGYGGHAGGSSWKGSIWSMNAESAVLAQFQVTKGLFFAAGPVGGFLITNYENLTRSWWYLQQANGIEETSEFSRKYFLKPSFGIKAMLMEMNLCKKISLGLSFEYLWRNYQEYQDINTYNEIFQYSQTSEISLYLGLR